MGHDQYGDLRRGLAGRELFGEENVKKIKYEDLKYAYKIENIGELTFSELLLEIEKLKEAEKETFDLKVSFTNINDSLGKLEEASKLISEINSEVQNNGRISSSTLSKISETYPEMTESLYKYQLGLIGEKDILTELEKKYNQQKNEYIDMLQEENSNSEEFMNNLRDNYSDFFTYLSSTYGIDLSNWTTVAKAKKDIDSKLIQDLQGIFFGVR